MTHRALNNFIFAYLYCDKHYTIIFERADVILIFVAYDTTTNDNVNYSNTISV